VSDQIDLESLPVTVAHEARELRKRQSTESDLRFPLRAQLARNLVRLRTERGWTQEDLAEKTGLHRNQIGAIEQRRQSTGIDIIQILSHTFGVLPGELLDPYPAQSGVNPDGPGRSAR
jgi:ribosome-binding protein aMBF1 (putative translation factor)